MRELSLVEGIEEVTTCKIGWIDNNGVATFDTNPAIMEIRIRERTQIIHGREIHFTASQWYPCCSEHAKQLSEPGMHIWESREL